MLDDDLDMALAAKAVTLEAVIDSGFLATLDDGQICDLFELLCAEALYRYAMVPPGRCGLCLRETTVGRLCPRHRALLTKALETLGSGEAPEDRGPGV